MNRSLIRAVGRAVLVVVLVASAWYTGLSLYWWEWQRALFYGLVCLGSLSVMLFLVLQGRLDRLEQQVLSGGAGAPGAAAGADETIPTTPERSFGWLGPADRTFVFIPVLVGFGVAVSAAAALLERVAGFVVGPEVQDASSVGSGPRSASAPTARRRRTVVVAAAAMVVAALLVLAVPLIGALVYAPGQAQEGRRVVELEVRGKRVDVDAVATVTVLAGYCQTQTRAPVRVDAVEQAGPGVVRLVIQPRLHADDQRRFNGCLSDYVVDRHTVSVVGVEDLVDQPVASTPERSSASSETST